MLFGQSTDCGRANLLAATTILDGDSGLSLAYGQSRLNVPDFTTALTIVSMKKGGMISNWDEPYHDGTCNSRFDGGGAAW